MGEYAVRDAIYKEKYYHNKKRDNLDLPGFGRINIVKSEVEGKPNMIRMEISIAWSGENL